MPLPYHVAAAVFSIRPVADTLAAALRKRGFHAIVRVRPSGHGKSTYTVETGDFISAADAQEQMQLLRRDGYPFNPLSPPLMQGTFQPVAAFFFYQCHWGKIKGMTVMLNSELIQSDRPAPLQVSHLAELEAESIFVIREVAAQFERPVLLFSGGKDSIILSHLARKAFWPARIPFPLLHIDTGHNFPETLSYRDEWMEKIGAKLLVRSVQDSIDQGRAVEEKGYNASRNMLQTVTLLDAIEELKVDAALGGARRDEEKARAKERFFSHRDEFGQWDPKNQRPELWNLFNGHKQIGEHFRVFPISNWTEMDVWQYILQEEIDLPSLYFTHQREVIDRDGNLLADSDYLNKRPTETPEMRQVRFRTIGDMTCTGAVLSPANSWKKSSRKSPPPARPSAAPAPTTSAPKPPWKTAKKKAISNG